MKISQKLTLTSFTSAKILSEAIPIISIVRILAGGSVQYSGAVYPETTQKNKKIENDILFFCKLILTRLTSFFLLKI